MRFFFAKIFRKTVLRHSNDILPVSRTCRREILANLQCEIFETRARYVCRATVLRKHANTSRLPGEKIKLSDIRTNVVRHSRMSCDCRKNGNENKATFVRTS